MILSPEKIIHQLWRFLISNPILIENSRFLSLKISSGSRCSYSGYGTTPLSWNSKLKDPELSKNKLQIDISKTSSYTRAERQLVVNGLACSFN